MKQTYILGILAIYFCLLLLVSWWTNRQGGHTNKAFFTANKQSPWYIVAFGMIGATISGVTFVSVSGMALAKDMYYMQMCLGFAVGYYIVAYVLLPIYYKLKTPSIYSLIGQRIGSKAHSTASAYFLLSRMLGTAAKLYLVCMIIHSFLLPSIPFWGITIGAVTMVWIYTKNNGLQTVVWTDTLQTACVIASMVWIIFGTIHQLHLSPSEALETLISSPHFKIFEWNNWSSSQHFIKQFLSGIFIVIVMTGLDQDMMQKNLTCRTLPDAQKNMITYGYAFIPLNFLLLCLGIFLGHLVIAKGLSTPESTDQLLPMIATQGGMGNVFMTLFAIGIIAAAFGNTDSALTSMTTCMYVDFIAKRKLSKSNTHLALINPENTKRRKYIHLGLAIILALCILLFNVIQKDSVLDLIFKLASYTYGPILGLFIYAIFSLGKNKYAVDNVDKYVVYFALLSPLCTYIIQYIVEKMTGYRFGYEGLLINGGIMWGCLWISTLCSKKLI